MALRKSRGRSKLGCISCRQRRIKCDEKLPTCDNCSRKGIRCEGVRQHIFASDLVKPIDPFPTRSAREVRAFQWIVMKSQSDSTNCIDRNFWAKAVPCMALQDDMVWYSVCAMSMLYERGMEDDYYRRQSMEWYGRSLRANSTTRSTPLLTLSTFVFACVEMLYGRPQNGLKLMYQAFQINQGFEATADKELLEAVLPYLFRALLPLSIFGFELSEEERGRAKMITDGQTTETKVLRLMSDLYNVAYDAQRYCNSFANIIPDEVALKLREGFIEQMLEWRAGVECAGVLESTGEIRRLLAQNLVVYNSAMVRLKCLWETTLDAFDAHEKHFEIIVSESEKCLAFNDAQERKIPFDIAVVPCLFYATWACRRPSIRRRALKLLREKAPREENLWAADNCVSIMEAAIAYEEGTDVFVPEVTHDVYPPLEMRLPESRHAFARHMPQNRTVDTLSGMALVQLPYILSTAMRDGWPIPASPMAGQGGLHFYVHNEGSRTVSAV